MVDMATVLLDKSRLVQHTLYLPNKVAGKRT